MTPPLPLGRRCRLSALALLCLGFITSLLAQATTGTIEGRVTNPATGTVLERARIAVDGSELETFSDADGYYRLTEVPAGTVQLRATFSGFPATTSSITLTGGQTAQKDFQLAPLGAGPADGGPIKLDQFVVATSREMSGAALAINEQRYAANMKNVVATDEFGDIAEGNVAEFLKFLPGVNIDYAGGNAREVSLDGIPGDYVPVTIDGFSLASAVGGGAGGTNRMVGLDQVSINNISRIEVNFTPTPDSPGNALAGTVNMVPRSSFERSSPLFNFSTYVMMRDNARNWSKTPAPRHPTRKIHPGADFSYVNPVSKTFGYTLSAGFNRQYSGEPQAQMFWRGTQQPTNGVAFPTTSYDRPYLGQFAVRNSGKDTKRSSFGFTADWKFTPRDRLSFSFQASTFDVSINHNLLTFGVDRVNPGDFTTTSTRSAPGAGWVQMVTTGNDRSNWTYMPSVIWRHDGATWKTEAGYAHSRARNRNNNLKSGFFDTVTVRRNGLNVAFDDIFYLRPRVIRVTTQAGAPVDPYSLSTYALTQASDNTRGTDDTKRTAYGNVRRDFRGPIPFTLRTGLDLRQSIRDQRAGNPAYNYFGLDNVASAPANPAADDNPAQFLDPSFSSRIAPYGFPKIQGVSNEKVFEFWQANPNAFRFANAANAYRNPINLSKRAEELISAAYLRGDVSLLQHRLKIVGGVRVEQTNIEAEGPLTDPTLNYQRDAQGRYVLGANGRPVNIVPTTDALAYARQTFIDRGARSKKEYLRWFPSLNASYNITESFILRAGYSTSIGRPDFNQYSGGIILPDTENPQPTDVIDVANVGIKPWSARTFATRLEYYFKGVGNIEVGAFRRDFEDFFETTRFNPPASFFDDYGIDPTLYGGYPVATTTNISDTVRIQGIKVAYKQALTFLPHWARGVSIFANGTSQRLLGPAATNFDGFVPKTASWGASLNRGKYALRANWNYRGHQRRLAIANPGPTTSIEPGTYTWWSKRLYLDLNAEFTFYKRFALYAALRNVGDAPDDVQVYGPSTPEHAQFRQRIEFGSLWTFGIKGSF